MGLVLTGELWKDGYEKVGLRPEMLSRCMEEGATVSAPLMPWTTCGAYMINAMGVYSFAYLPFAFYNLIQIALGILIPLTGLSLLTITNKKPPKKKPMANSAA